MIENTGVHFDWGFSKTAYHRPPLTSQKIYNMCMLVKHYILRETITIYNRQKFARQSRQYILAYHALVKQRLESGGTGRKECNVQS